MSLRQRLGLPTPPRPIEAEQPRREPRPVPSKPAWVERMQTGKQIPQGIGR